MTIAIAPLVVSDFSEWLKLWDENNHHQCPQEVTNSTWSRLLDPASSVKGFAARADGRMAGLVHYILHPVTGHIEPACYMQDLYVGENFRRRGVARDLVEHLAAEGKRRNWARLYWLAENANPEAQALYKNIGIRLDFSLHIMPL